MTTYMPPIARKKRVDERYNPDTFRVISTNAEDTHAKFEPQSYRASFEPPTPVDRLFPDIDCHRTRVLPKPTADFRANNPHPKSCSFIRTDVRLLNEPVCTVYTKETHPTQHRWWPARANPGTLEPGDHTLDTIYRNDFLYTKNLAPQPTYRHSANPNIEPSRGIAPVNFLKEKDNQGFYKESVSFEHQYNSRTDPNYPIRAKRHGSFVYSKMDAGTKQKFIDHHTKLNAEEQAAAKQSPQPEVEWEVQVSNKATSPLSPMSPITPQRSMVCKASSDQMPEMLPTSSSPVEWFEPPPKGFGQE